MVHQQNQNNKIRSVTLTDSSMQPFLFDGDGIYFKPVSFGKVQVDDIIVFNQSGNLMCHRVIYKTKAYVITKGDGSNVSDGKIRPRQIVGKLTRVKRKGKIFDPELMYAYQSGVYLKEIKKITKLLKKRNIEYVFLKGLPLHLYYDKSLPRRIYADIDILISPDNYEGVRNLLEKQNYKQEPVELFGLQKLVKSPNTPEFEFVKMIRSMPVRIDVHLEPVFMMTKLGNLNEMYSHKQITMLTNELLSNKTIVSINESPFPILNPIALSVYLCLHFFHHNYQGMYRLSFLSKVLIIESKKSKYFWSEFVALVKKYQFANYVYPTLVMTKKYYFVSVPPFVFNQLQSLITVKNDKLLLIAQRNPLDEDNRLDAGVKRLLLLYDLSPRSVISKIRIIGNIYVLSTTMWMTYKKIISAVNNRLGTMSR